MASESVLDPPATVSCSTPLKILVGNDDGWAEASIRALYQTLNAAGHDVILSAPVRDHSGVGSLDAPATPLWEPGQYDSVPVGAPAEGADDTDPRLHYVNSFPVTAIKYGIETLAPIFFGGAPDIVLTGPNIGNNFGASTWISGTVAAAAEAIKQGIPAIAFSGDLATARSHTTLQPRDSVYVYAQIAQKLVETLTATPKPWLPPGFGLNVNFPEVPLTGAKVGDFQFVMTCLYPRSDRIDVVICNNGGHLPSEAEKIWAKDKLYVTITVFNAYDLQDASAEHQAVVLDKLSSILVCS